MTAYSELANKYSPQLGEISWHQFTLDPRIHSQSRERFKFLSKSLDENQIKPTRILELCPNDRYTIHLLSEKYKCEVYGVDISARAMKRGMEIAASENIASDFYGVACDFHSLPFPANHFDLIYVYQSIHHTRNSLDLIAELSRCLNIGGLIFLMEEPFERETCSYLFEGNRKESYSAYETSLQKSEIANYVTHPDACSRPEALFGMIENQQITLNSYFNTLNNECEILETSINDGDIWKYATDLDKYFLSEISEKKDGALSLITHTLIDKFNNCEINYSVADKLMDIKHPSKEKIDEIALKIFNHLNAIASSDSLNQNIIASAFGGLIKISAKKIRNLQYDVSSSFQISSKSRFSEHPLIVDNLFIDLSHPLLPDLQYADEKEILDGNIFPKDCWSRVNEVGDLTSYVNVTNNLLINIPGDNSEGVLVLRYYAIAGMNPYQINFFINKKLVDTHWICQSETRLFKYFYVENVLDFSISYELAVVHNNSLIENIRIGYLQNFPIRNVAVKAGSTI